MTILASLAEPTLNRSHPALELSFLPTPLHIIQLSPSDSIPQKLLDAVSATSSPPFISISRTPYETSIILPTALYGSIYTSASDTAHPPPKEVEGPWSCLVVKGPMDLSLTGIMHALCGPLKEAHVPVFASSTWNTDYVLVNASKREQARQALVDDGWKFSD